MVSGQVQEVVVQSDPSADEVRRIEDMLATRSLDAKLKVSLVFDNFGVAGVRLMLYNPSVEQTGTAVSKD